MSHEFVVCRHVSELMKQIGLPSSSDPVVYVNALENRNNSSAEAQISLYDAKKKILEYTTTSQAFLEKYKELKSKNIKELDSFVCLISRLLDDSQVISLLKKTPTQVVEPKVTKITSVEQVGSSISSEEVGKLQAEISESTSRQPSSSSGLTKVVLTDETINPPKKLNCPTFPDWIHERPHMSLDFIPDRITIPFIEDVRSIPVGRQEMMLVDDLLYCCEGIEGRFIRCEPLEKPDGARRFKVHPRLDPSLIRMAERILPMCSMYSGIVRFIERSYDFKHGLVKQALVAAISSIMKDYSLLIARLEHQQRSGNLNLQKFWFYIQTTMHTMEVLSSIISSIQDNCMGGSVLSALHEMTLSNTGDIKFQKLCFHLTQAASVPYFEILENWIYKGIISDPYFEFMVVENDDIHKEKLGEDFNDAYWDTKYTLKVKDTPVFLKKISSKILNTGKYLNVIRECGRDVCCPSAECLEYDSNENQFIDKIENAMQYASSLLLDVLMREMDLMTRLRSIKHYFLLDKGDFIVQFMDMAKHEMKKRVEDIHLPRLETLVELALRTSTANADPYKDDLK